MRKRLALAVALVSGIAIFSGGGCSSSSNDAAPVDARVDVTIGQPGDTGPCGPLAGDGACFDRTSVLTFNIAPAAPKANQDKCASDDLITQFLSACIQKTDAGADAGDTCDAYLVANTDCALCLGGFGAPDAAAPTNLPWPALGQVNLTQTLPAVAVCIAAISAGTDTCKSNYANDNLCAESGCSANCSDPDLAACTTAQTTDPCSTCLIANPLDSACVAAINAVSQTDADTKCGASTVIATDTDFENVFLKVGRTLCEGPGADE